MACDTKAYRDTEVADGIGAAACEWAEDRLADYREAHPDDDRSEYDLIVAGVLD